ncbi:transcription factor bHLH143-like [Olea europaea var. sylvestris]|uniref:transcription factor bHLH143-like n=1 Tax=Olea europaea var. sylvestris TaxID=158386 RepID=UPI000C1D844E|nr:transcription factor bHLH143-like [Olea europaea var. sylvestris]XP_022896225.1 transcription factor bHLH143-like [Olea europaea var. sylvestris]
MVTSRELQTHQHFSAWNFPLPTSDCMALMQPGQIYSSPRPPHSSRSIGMDISPCSVSDLPDTNLVQLNGVDGFFKGLSPLWESSSPSIHPHSKDSQCAVPHGRRVGASIIDASHTCLKRFLIVDQSRNHTRLFFNPFPFPSPQNQIVSSKTPGVHASCNEKLAVQVEKQSLLMSVIQEKWNENQLTDGGSEMHEDAKEIDALLYSDTDDEFDEDDADQENNEVTSRVRTPFGTEEGYDEDIQFEELIEEVASSDGSTKRRRLLDGRYKLSSLLVDEGPIKLATSCNYKDDAESSVVHEINSFGDSSSTKRLKKVKICKTLNIFKSIIPGLKSKDPQLIIDKAINYLTSLKYEAESTRISYPLVFNGAVG